MVRHSSRDSIENILRVLEPVERVANDPVADGSESNCLASNSAKTAWVLRTAFLCFKICTMGKISVTSSMVIRPGTNLSDCFSKKTDDQSLAAAYHIGGTQYLFIDAKLSV